MPLTGAPLWGDVDEPRSRWRIATSKTGRPRWVTSPSLLRLVTTVRTSTHVLFDERELDYGALLA